MVKTNIQVDDNWSDVQELIDKLNRIMQARNAYVFLNKESEKKNANPDSILRRARCCTANDIKYMENRFAEDANTLITEYVNRPFSTNNEDDEEFI